MSVNFNFLLQYNSLLLSAKWLVRIQEQLVPVNSLLLSAEWLVRTQEQLVPVNSFLLSVKWLVHIQEQLVPVNLFHSCYRSSNQFKYKNSLYLPFVSTISQVASSNPRTACALFTCQYSRSSSQFEPKEQLALVKFAIESPQWVLLLAILLMSTNPAMDTTCSVVCYSVNVYQSRNGYDILCCLLFY